jgi:hypothetical protein
MTIFAAAVSTEKMRSPLSRYCFSSSRVTQANAGFLQVVRPQITQLLGEPTGKYGWVESSLSLSLGIPQRSFSNLVCGGWHN